MNSQKLSGAVSCLAAILILAADKIFAPVCKGTMELANGGECMMRCHYYGITLFLFGLLLLAESVLLFFGTHDFKLPVVIIITAVLILLLSNTSIGIVFVPRHVCDATKLLFGKNWCRSGNHRCRNQSFCT